MGISSRLINNHGGLLEVVRNRGPQLVVISSAFLLPSVPTAYGITLICFHVLRSLPEGFHVEITSNLLIFSSRVSHVRLGQVQRGYQQFFQRVHTY